MWSMLCCGYQEAWPTGRQVEKQKASFTDEKLWSQKIIGKQPNWQKQAWANPENDREKQNYQPG